MDAPQLLAIMGALGAWVVVFFAIRRWGPGQARRSVRCPTKKLRAKVLVDQREGHFGSLRVVDVTRCSLFPNQPLTCGKQCLPRFQPG